MTKYRKIRFRPKRANNRMDVALAADETQAFFALKAIKKRAKIERYALRESKRPKPSLPKFNLPPMVED